MIYRQNVKAAKGKVVNKPEAVTVRADAVICTIPLGILKRSLIPHSTDSLTFQPPLPKWKNDAISNMGYGSLNKVL